ncbi:MAG TPA: hypothetical protein PLT31_03115 [Fibrobacteraceae bacterium]|nr:hypothetical protein [Fibrobacteraceae bacterium]
MPDFNLFRFQNQLNTKPLEEGLARDYENAGRSIGGLIGLGLKIKGDKEAEEKNAALEKNKKDFLNFLDNYGNGLTDEAIMREGNRYGFPEIAAQFVEAKSGRLSREESLRARTAAEKESRDTGKAIGESNRLTLQSNIQDLEDEINELTLKIKSRSKESQEARNLAAKRNALKKRANDMKKNYEIKFGPFESNLIDDDKIETDDSVYEEIESIVDRLKDNDSFIKEFSGLSDTFQSLEKDDASKTLDKLKLFESKLEKNKSALKDRKDKAYKSIENLKNKTVKGGNVSNNRFILDDIAALHKVVYGKNLSRSEVVNTYKLNLVEGEDY